MVGLPYPAPEDEADHGSALRVGLAGDLQAGGVPSAFAAAAGGVLLQAAFAPAGEHHRVDVALAADGGCIAERRGNLAHHRLLQPRQRALAGGRAVGAIRQRGPGEALERGEGAAPGAEVLRAELRARGPA